MNTGISVTTVTDEISGNSVNIYLAGNAENVSPAVLRSLALASPICGLIATAACSLSNGVAIAHSHTLRQTDGAPTLIATAVHTLTHADRVILDGATFCFSDTQGRLADSDP